MPRLQAFSPVSLTIVPFDPDQIDRRSCPRCSRSMAVHQPDVLVPDRLLWTCYGCGTWLLMDIEPDKLEAVLVCLHPHGQFRSSAGR